VSDVARNLADVKRRIAQACEDSARSPETVTLVAVSKTVPVEAIREAYEAGQRDFGESRLQEALPKIAALPRDIRWHFVGRLQSNKAKAAGRAFNVVHSLESPHQIRELAKAGCPLDVLIEVNLAEEPQKSGIRPADLAKIRASVLQWSTLRLRGLMGIGPAHRNAEAMRPYFRELRALNDSIGGDWLSMGMSNDFEVAIQEGSTHVRVGSAIFGERQGTTA
jgi:hypothetical protein